MGRADDEPVRGRGRDTVRQSGQGYPTAGPEKAVDGNTSGDPNDVSYAQLGNPPNLSPRPFWEVDLGGIEWISEVKLWSFDGPENAHNKLFYVLVSDVPFVSDDDLSAASSQPGVWVSPRIDNEIPRMLTVPVHHKGRYVRIQKDNRETLYLTEVQVLQVPWVNGAKGKAAWESAPGYGGAELAVDGNTSGNPNDLSVAYAGGDGYALPGFPNPLWEVDLGERQLIDRLRIWNFDYAANYRNRDFYVFVSDTRSARRTFRPRATSPASGRSTERTRYRPGVLEIPVGRTGQHIRIQVNQQDYFLPGRGRGHRIRPRPSARVRRRR